MINIEVRVYGFSHVIFLSSSNILTNFAVLIKPGNRFYKRSNSEVSNMSKLLYLQMATHQRKTRRITISRAGFEPAIPVFKLPNTLLAMPLRGQQEFRFTFSEVYVLLFRIGFHRLIYIKRKPTR
jgi:hypothetical protein